MTPAQVPAIITMLTWASLLSRIRGEESAGKGEQRHGKSFCWAEWSYQRVRRSNRTRERWPHSDNFRLSHACWTETTLARVISHNRCRALPQPEHSDVHVVQNLGTFWRFLSEEGGGGVYGEWDLMEKANKSFQHMHRLSVNMWHVLVYCLFFYSQRYVWPCVSELDLVQSIYLWQVLS